MEFLVAVGTIVMAVFTALVWKINRRMEWLTGAMESHSETMMKLTAQEKGIPMELWDPSEEPLPRRYGHKEPYTLDKIYIGVHPALRKSQPSLCYRFGCLVGDIMEMDWRTCWNDLQRGRRAEEYTE